MRIARPLPLAFLFALSACSACGASSAPETPLTPEPPVAPEVASYEVHEWGLIRGTMLDQVMLSGPHVDPVPVPVAKPVLYFHRAGVGALRVDVGVTIPNGRIVEHWPLVPGAAEPLAWRGVEIADGNCAGSSYPSLGQPPCDAIHPSDACEAAGLATVETPDGACVRYGGAAFDHLFYRGEIRGAPALPLAIAREGDALRVTASGPGTIPGSILRIRRSTREVSVVPAPGPGASVALPPPGSTAATGADALAASLRAAGLTDAEVGAFRRAWDASLFGGEIASVTTIPPVAAASPMPVGGELLPASDDAVLYVLPIERADALAPLTFSPPPRAVRRAIVAWIDASSGAPARP